MSAARVRSRRQRPETGVKRAAARPLAPAQMPAGLCLRCIGAWRRAHRPGAAAERGRAHADRPDRPLAGGHVHFPMSCTTSARWGLSSGRRNRRSGAPPGSCPGLSPRVVHPLEVPPRAVERPRPDR